MCVFLFPSSQQFLNLDSITTSRPQDLCVVCESTLEQAAAAVHPSSRLGLEMHRLAAPGSVHPSSRLGLAAAVSGMPPGLAVTKSCTVGAAGTHTLDPRVGRQDYGTLSVSTGSSSACPRAALAALLTRQGEALQALAGAGLHVCVTARRARAWQTARRARAWQTARQARAWQPPRQWPPPVATLARTEAYEKQWRASDGTLPLHPDTYTRGRPRRHIPGSGPQDACRQSRPMRRRLRCRHSNHTGNCTVSAGGNK